MWYQKTPWQVFFDMHSGRPVTTSNRDTPILSCQCGEGEIRNLQFQYPLADFLFASALQKSLARASNLSILQCKIAALRRSRKISCEGKKRGGERCQEPFLGRPRGVIVVSSLNSLIVWSVHSADPYGLPRIVECRIESTSFFDCDSLRSVA